MRELGVNRDTKDLGVEGLELIIAVAEGGNLSGADKCEIERIEEENNILALELAKLHVHKLLIKDSSGTEFRGGISDQGSNGLADSANLLTGSTRGHRVDGSSADAGRSKSHTSSSLAIASSSGGHSALGVHHGDHVA